MMYPQPGPPPHGGYAGGPAPWQPPAHAHVPTVARAPLQPGERVIYFHKKMNGGSERVLSIILGIVTIPILIGIYLLYTAIRWNETVDAFYVITNQRLFTVNLLGGVREQVWLHEITNLSHRTGNGSNSLTVEGASGGSITFRHQEGHVIARLRPMLEGLRNPAFMQQLPNVPFEP